MIQAKCIEKYRDNQGRIYGYKLVDLNGQTQEVKSENLKKAIANKSIHVVNLTLTSDNRLVDTTEKQLKSKDLDYRFEYKSASNISDSSSNDTDKTSDMEAFMLQAAKTILKSFGFSGEIKELDNSYDGMIDKRYDTTGQYMYFDEEESMLAITYHDKDYDGVDKPEFWLAIEVDDGDISSMHTESTSKDDIKNIIAKFIKEVKPHISF